MVKSSVFLILNRVQNILVGAAPRMVNILGQGETPEMVAKTMAPLRRALRVPDAGIHWYGKDTRNIPSTLVGGWWLVAKVCKSELIGSQFFLFMMLW